MFQEAHDISTFVHKMNSESSPAMSFILFYLAYGIFVGKININIDDTTSRLIGIKSRNFGITIRQFIF